MKYPYKTKIAEHGKVLISLIDFECAKVTKLDFGKSTVSDLAKQCFMEEIQERINNRQEIPVPKPYPFVAEYIELDWKTVLRIQLSNWIIKNSRLDSFDAIYKRYEYMVDRRISTGVLSKDDIFGFFNTKIDLDVVGLLMLAYDFEINIDFKEVKLELRDK